MNEEEHVPALLPRIKKPGPLRLLVCGSRTFEDMEYVNAVLNQLLEDNEVQCLVYGMAKGADTLAYRWAKKHKILVLGFPANWREDGKAAGPIRNTKMLAEGKPNLCIAFVDKTLELSRGTNDMVTKSIRAGVTTHVYMRRP